MASSEIAPENYEDRYLEADDSEDDTSVSGSSEEGNVPDFGFDSGSSGSEYNVDDEAEESDSGNEGGGDKTDAAASKVSKMGVSDSQEEAEGEDFECVDQPAE